MVMPLLSRSRIRAPSLSTQPTVRSPRTSSDIFAKRRPEVETLRVSQLVRSRLVTDGDRLAISNSMKRTVFLPKGFNEPPNGFNEPPNRFNKPPNGFNEPPNGGF